LKELPYFAWYASDAKADENYSALTDEELGFYHRCLNDAWINDGIPLDMALLSRQMKVTPVYLKRVWISVGRLFVEVGGRLRSPRQEKERAKALSKSTKSKTSADKRWDIERQRKSNANADANALPMQCELDARASESVYASVSLEVNSKPETKPITREPALLDDFQLYRDVCAMAGIEGSDADWISAGFEWRKLDFVTKLRVASQMKERIAGGELDDPQYRPLPHNYLTKWINRPLRTRSEGKNGLSDAAMLRKMKEMGM
jgi:uncharacterized protein YdaU (DUF1376 family)